VLVGRAGDLRGHCLLVGARQQRVARAPGDQGWCGNGSGVERWFGRQQSLERIVQTRAGTLRFSRQSTSMIASGTSHPTIPSLSARTNAASIGSSIAATTSAKGGPRSAQAAGRAEQRQTQDPVSVVDGEPLSHVPPRSMRLRARLRAA
jgi:hypothetical protein